MDKKVNEHHYCREKSTQMCKFQVSKVRMLSSCTKCYCVKIIYPKLIMPFSCTICGLVCKLQISKVRILLSCAKCDCVKIIYSKIFMPFSWTKCGMDILYIIRETSQIYTVTKSKQLTSLCTLCTDKIEYLINVRQVLRIIVKSCTLWDNEYFKTLNNGG